MNQRIQQLLEHGRGRRPHEDDPLMTFELQNQNTFALFEVWVHDRTCKGAPHTLCPKSGSTTCPQTTNKKEEKGGLFCEATLERGTKKPRKTPQVCLWGFQKWVLIEGQGWAHLSCPSQRVRLPTTALWLSGFQCQPVKWSNKFKLFEISSQETSSSSGWWRFLLQAWVSWGNSHLSEVHCFNSLIMRLNNTGVSFEYLHFCQTGLQF